MNIGNIICILFLIVIVVIIFNNLLNNETYYIKKINNRNPVQTMNNKKICIVQFDNRKKLDESLETLMEINRTYCSKYDSCDYIRFYDDLQISPYWAKVKHVQNVMKDNKYDYIMWVDTDAAIDMDIDIIDYIDKNIENKSFLGSTDPPMLNIHNVKIPMYKIINRYSDFNAGVWVVKNNEIGKKMIDEWIDLYDPSLWENKDKKWKCTNYGLPCIWASCPGYEQGCFIKYIIPKYEEHIKMINWDIINNPYFDDKENKVHHFAGPYKDKLKFI